jgi:hypothetical protein
MGPAQDMMTSMVMSLIVTVGRQNGHLFMYGMLTDAVSSSGTSSSNDKMFS